MRHALVEEHIYGVLQADSIRTDTRLQVCPISELLGAEIMALIYVESSCICIQAKLHLDGKFLRINI